MRANVAYIFSYGDDEEVENGCGALILRAGKRCGRVVHHNMTNNGIFKPKTEPEGELKVTIDVGAYVLFHATGPETTAKRLPTPDDLVGRMKAVMENDLVKLAKVVFLACAIAPKKKDFANGAHDPGKAIGYLMTFLLELQKIGVCPRVAGYDNFVTLVPIESGEDDILTHAGKEAKVLESQEYKAHAGRKVGRNKENAWVLARVKGGNTTKSYSQAHKRVFYFESGQIHVADGGGWSDN